MKNVKKKELIICIIAILSLISIICNKSFAMDLAEELGSQNKNNVKATTIITGENNITGNNIASNNTNTNTNKNVSTNKNVNTNKNSLANAGVESSSIFIIVVFGLSAVYAYKKIREYNV